MNHDPDEDLPVTTEEAAAGTTEGVEGTVAEAGESTKADDDANESESTNA